ncbi:MAG TPA: HlyC/CorC family transporter [Burkholderiales bacterium]|nr:HlyC/CorC family transporter [Anaerolineales bacterium]HXF18375.1 HlyC/CorC family transporter [Burkholderiales bacterium]
MDEIPLSSLLIAIVILLVISAFFSISETSMMALNRYRLRHLTKTGHRGARIASQLLAQVDRLLGVVLLGNTLVNAGATTLATVIAIRLFGGGEIVLSLSTAVVAFMLLVFSEITPKIIGATRPETIAFPAGYILAPLLKIAYPVTWFVNLFVRGLLWLVRFHPNSNQPHTLSMEELRTLILEGGNFLPQKHQNILMNLFDLESITVEDAMTPRNQIEAIDIDSPPDEIRRQIAISNHTRLPVYRERLDDIVGIVHVRKVLNLSEGEQIDAKTLTDVLREPYFIPMGTPLLTQLQNFQEQQDRMGLVVDEYGELKGLLTLEDILEEIIGEFTTQSPLQSARFRRMEDGSIIVEGATLLRDMNRKLGYKFPLDGPKTLNGLILEHFQDIPESGTSLKLAGYPIEVLQTQDRVIKSIRLLPPDNG